MQVPVTYIHIYYVHIYVYSYVHIDLTMYVLLEILFIIRHKFLIHQTSFMSKCNPGKKQLNFKYSLVTNIIPPQRKIHLFFSISFLMVDLQKEGVVLRFSIVSALCWYLLIIIKAVGNIVIMNEKKNNFFPFICVASLNPKNIVFGD